MKERKDIEEKYKWDLSPLCKDYDEFYSRCEEIKTYTAKFEAMKGKLNTKENLKKYFALNREFDDKLLPVYLYASSKSDEILTDNERAKLSETIDKIYNDFCVATSFITNELNELSDEFLDQLIADPEFADQDRFFIGIKKSRKHILSEKEEKLIAGMDFLGGFKSNMRKLVDADFKFEDVLDSEGNKHPLNNSTRIQYLKSKDRTLRKNTSMEYSKVYSEHKNFFANNYINHVKASCYFAKVRNYDSALSAALEDDEIDPKVYTSLIENVHKNLPMINRYYKLKQKELGLDEIYGYDLMADIGQEKESKLYSYEEAIQLIKNAVAPLGENYVKLVERAVQERWIDVYPNKDKRTGGYCTGICVNHPYILFNFDGTYYDVNGIAHELGHAMHTLLMHNAQPHEKRDYPIFLAEMASTTNEILFFNYMLSKATTNGEKRKILNDFFGEVDAAIFSQTRLSEFEQKIHALCEENQPLTKDVLADVYKKLNEEYGGIIKTSEGAEYGWSRIPHLFRDFYVFCYATGMIAAIAFANNILAGKEGALERYIEFLSAGDSVDPMTALEKAGCDLTDEKTYASCFEYLSGLLDTWEKLV